MGKILEFDWDNEEELKTNLQKWAYNADLKLIEQDEDLLFHDLDWLQLIFPYMFDSKCVKQKHVTTLFLEYTRQAFLHRREHDIEQIYNLFIKNIKTHNSTTGDTAISQCLEYYLMCKQIFEGIEHPDLEQVIYVGKILLNGLTNNARINNPTIMPNGNYQITSSSSVKCYLCVDKVTGRYKYNGYKPCE